jgi:hypothetical protein
MTFIPVQKDNLYVDILAILVQEILEEMRDRFVGDVAAHDNMSANTTKRLDCIPPRGDGLYVHNGKRKVGNSQATTMYTLYVVYV